MPRSSSTGFRIFAIIPCHRCTGNIVVYREGQIGNFKYNVDANHKENCQYYYNSASNGSVESLKNLVDLFEISSKAVEVKN